MNHYTSTYFLLFFILVSLLSCRDPSSGGEAVPMGEECNINCGQGDVLCENGFCVCPEGVREVARGFCVSRERGFDHAFVTYDQYEDMLDTMIVAFREDPYELRWENGENGLQIIPAYSYNRNVGTENPGSSPAVFVYSGDPQNQVDTVVLLHLYVGDRKGIIRRGAHYCKYNFRGGFVDRNTIRGNLIVYQCLESGEGGTPRPEELPNVGDRFPVTFTRIPD